MIATRNYIDHVMGRCERNVFDLGDTPLPKYIEEHYGYLVTEPLISVVDSFGRIQVSDSKVIFDMADHYEVWTLDKPDRLKLMMSKVLEHLDTCSVDTDISFTHLVSCSPQRGDLIKVLDNLIDNGIIRLHRQGVGRRPNQYTKL